ncbi:HlyD family secretion protein [Herbaspirillum sp. YR522]|uniref:HlyD family secretion protein n=1 Tax=Herbaspirillum sp. YR522 TaxID=1144342 RepID=UPI00026F6506|nr:HlyD family secretion protein [Herbaspirillum sp. YR522]EJN07176.1 multidrug resistance efflux pump [Herbaspirillum sp. YR522]
MSTQTIPPSSTPGRRGWLKLLLLAMVAIALVAWGVYWFSVGRHVEGTDDAYVGGDITVIAPKVAGNIEQVLVQDNQAVRAGEVLVKLDQRDFLAALARARAAVAAQQAALVNVDAERRLQDSVIEQGRAAVAAADSETARSRDDRQRYQNLVAKSAVSLQSAQRADAEFHQAQANGHKAQAALAATRRQQDVIAARRQQIEAALQQAQADLQMAQLNLAYTELRAPVDGVVGNRRARVGAYANVGAQLLSVVPAQGLWVDANFKESQIARMHTGQPVVIKADVLPGEHFSGHVVSLAPATGAQFSVLPAENATGNFTKIVQRVPVRIALDGEAARLGRLRPGLSVSADVDLRDDRS